MTSDTKNDFDVVIIGGGMAGVSTLYHLAIDKNYNGRIGVLEARNRWGGRICSSNDLSSKSVEMGANWIHGVLNNPICELAFKHKLIDPLGAEEQPSVESVQSKRYFISGVLESGDRVPLSIIEDTYNTYFWFIKNCESYYHDSRDEDMKIQSKKDEMVSKFKNSVGAHLASDIKGYLDTKAKDNVSIRKAIFRNLLQRESCISGSHTMLDVTLHDFGAYDELPGGNLTINGGYILIINLLLDAVDQMIEVKKKSGQTDTLSFEPFLGHVVEKIKWKSPKMSSVNGDNKIIVTCSNGSVFSCNHLVITLPLGVLKHDMSSLFEPLLPQYKMDSVQSLGFNCVNKIFLEFRHKLSPTFLDGSVNEFLLFWTDSGDDNHASGDETKYDIIKDEASHSKWWTTIYSLAKVSDRCLLAWVSGKEAQMIEYMDEKDVGSIITEEILRKFFHPQFPYPETILVTKWSSDVYSRGSYTFITPKSSVRDIEMLSQPIYTDPGQDKPSLLFAGESCHPSFFSTTHGAFLSGKKAASYLLDPDFSSTSSDKNP